MRLGRVFRPLPSGERASFSCARWVFLRALGLIYLIAFVSLLTQIHGLIGAEGILPVREWLRAVAGQVGPVRYWLLPTLCWLNASDAMLTGICVSGGLAALLLLLDVAPAAMLALLWALYLSLVTVGQDFLSFQWDHLMLEAGFLAIFLAPLRLGRGHGEDAPPARFARALTWWLLFRLMFSSGVVKLASGDAAWRQLTALTYHYETQPLPTWLGWYAHQWPAWCQRVSCGVMFGMELLVPWLIFTPRAGRHAAGLLLIGFQGLILLTGNYTFFNALTIALCLFLFDDAAWPEALRRPAVGGPAAPGPRGAWPRWLMGLVGAGLGILSLAPLSQLLPVPGAVARPFFVLYRAAAPLRIVNGYGLFAVMTTRRLEIEIEGSRDGQTWQPYAFPWKPGDVRRRPAFVAPHQPRLDWQMWFAALSRYDDAPWFLRFCEQLLRGSPAVLRLLAGNPFPEAPPRYLRAVAYEYHFTDGPTRRQTGAWWRRTRAGLYCPVLSLEASAR